MEARRRWKSAARGMLVAGGVAAAGYAALVAFNRMKYGQASVARAGRSSLLDRFIPAPEVVEHHQIDIAAPADIVMTTAKNMALMNSPLIRVIIRIRELALGGEPDRRPHPQALVEQMTSIGWVVLAERAGREVVLGSVTQPWEAAPVFRSVAPAEFLSFAEPGYVKIAWTLRADPVDAGHSIFHTETRVCTTDSEARRRFRRYWSFVAPGVELIRMAMLSPLKCAAERKVHAAA